MRVWGWRCTTIHCLAMYHHSLCSASNFQQSFRRHAETKKFPREKNRRISLKWFICDYRHHVTIVIMWLSIFIMWLSSSDSQKTATNSRLKYWLCLLTFLLACTKPESNQDWFHLVFLGHENRLPQYVIFIFTRIHFYILHSVCVQRTSYQPWAFSPPIPE